MNTLSKHKTCPLSGGVQGEEILNKVVKESLN